MKTINDEPIPEGWEALRFTDGTVDVIIRGKDMVKHWYLGWYVVGQRGMHPTMAEACAAHKKKENP